MTSLLTVLADAMREASELIDTYVDVKDGAYGMPEANDAMRAQRLLEAAISKAEHEIRKLEWEGVV